MATLRERVLGGETTIGCWVSSAAPFNVEALGRAGYDWLVLDTEHGMGAESDLLPQLYAAAGTPTTALVRIERSDRLRISRPLDFGAGGLVVPRISSADEVREALTWMRFPPTGQRGVALLARGQGAGRVSHGEINSLDDVALGVFQIETVAALRDVEAIAAVSGADVLFVGPADLTHALGIPGRFDDPVYLEAIRTVIAACRKHGKSTGILLYDPAVLARHLELGFTFVGAGSDGVLLNMGARAMLSAVGRAG